MIITTMRQRLFFIIASLMMLAHATKTEACTGITLKSMDGRTVVARTIEWGGSSLESSYVIVPRGYTHSSYINGQKDGMQFKARYGYVGMAVETEENVTEGLNEAGLSAGLFYFPHYGMYEKFDPSNRHTTIGDLQVVAWILSNFKTIDEVKESIRNIHITTADPRSSTVHWRIAEPSGRQVVLEIVNEKVNFYENTLGVLTNSPGFEWHMTNLNNYINLRPGTEEPREFAGITMASFGASSSMLGLPGDATPPSRFVRAAFYKATAPQKATANESVMQCFQILNNFDIPVGIEFAGGKIPSDIPSATQWTVATDMSGKKIYYRTMYNSGIRCIDLNSIDFGKVKYQSAPLDKVKTQPITMIKIK